MATPDELMKRLEALGPLPYGVKLKTTADGTHVVELRQNGWILARQEAVSWLESMELQRG